MSQNSENHHFVPRGLLKKWYSINPGENNGFRKYERNEDNKFILVKPIASVKNTGSEDHLNTTYGNLFKLNEECSTDTNSIEKELAKLDTKAIEIINKIGNSGEITLLTRKERIILSKFIISMYMRHPKTISLAKTMVSNNAKSATKIIENKSNLVNKPNHKELFFKSIGLEQMIVVLNEEKTYLQAESMRWELIKAKNMEFFSGHKPLVINFGKPAKKFGKSFALSLSPDILLVGIDKKMFSGNKYKQQEEIENFSKRYNFFVSKQSDYIVVSKELTDEQYNNVFKNI